MEIWFPPPNVGPFFEQLYMEWRPELCCPVLKSFNGAQPGWLTNESKKAFELCWYPQLKTNKQNGKKVSQTISVN